MLGSIVSRAWFRRLAMTEISSVAGSCVVGVGLGVGAGVGACCACAAIGTARQNKAAANMRRIRMLRRMNRDDAGPAMAGRPGFRGQIDFKRREVLGTGRAGSRGR